MHQTSWFLNHALTAINRRPRHAKCLARHIESRYCDIQADLFADAGGGVEVAAVDAPSADADGSSSDDDGGDSDGDSNSDLHLHPSGLSAAEYARQCPAFRLTKTGVPGVIRDHKGGWFRASFVSTGGKKTQLGSFDTIDEAARAIRSAYAGLRAEAVQ